MSCYELDYQVRVYKVAVRLRRYGWSAADVDLLTETALYGGPSVLAAWEAYVRALARNHQPKG